MFPAGVRSERGNAHRCSYRHARTALRDRLGRGHKRTVQVTAALGAVLFELGRREEAEEALVTAVEQGGRAIGVDHPAVLTASNNLARLRLAQERVTEAIELMERVHASQVRKIGPHHDLTLITLNNLASAFQRSDQTARAAATYQSIIAARREGDRYESHKTAIAWSNLGVCQEKLDQLEQL